jgi:glycosyltransferase involved in cell wall biosynthesis/peptidoglycan/xylan/chitin deacetylase (PgdA/CDA1 family)
MAGQTSSKMKLSVVLTTYNRRQSLVRCLASLTAQNFPAEQFEIIVVADGCTDGTVEQLRTFNAPCAFKLIEQQNQGQAMSQNIGVAAASGDLVLFMDDDCECDPELIAAHVRAHNRQEKLVVIGAMHLGRNASSSVIYEAKLAYTECRFQRLSLQGASRADMMLCANSSITRQAALLCPFNPTYQRIHDVEAGTRLWESGFRPIFEPSAVAFEHFAKTAEEIIRDSRYQGIFEVRLTRSHPSFKPFAGIVTMNEGNILKRTVRKQLALHPLIAETLLRSLGVLIRPLHAIRVFRRLELNALGARFVVALLDGAAREAGSWGALEADFGRRMPVIMYHNVGLPRPDEYPGLTTPVVEFESQIRLIARMGYQAILPSEWLAWRNKGAVLPNKPIMLVFDDGYAEACQNGFPVLEKYGMRAACMLVTSCIGITNQWDEKVGRPSFQLMSREQIADWTRRGFEFGGHSRSHINLGLATGADLQEEVAQCKQDLIALLDRVPDSFAYPFGGISRAAQKALSEHFELGFTAWQGRLHLGTDPSLVPRIFFPAGESKIGMWCRLLLERNPMEVCRIRLGRLMQAFGVAKKLDIQVQR